MDDLIRQLESIYGKRESESLLKVLMLDLLGTSSRTSILDLKDYQREIFRSAIKKLLEHKPVQYITNKAWFYGYEFYVNENVLIPRPETEELVEKAIELIKKQDYKSVLDIGCGSGCIPITIKLKRPEIDVISSDISIEALKIASGNAAFHKLEINFIEDDILEFDDSKYGHYDLIVSNPPYIARQESNAMTQNTLLHEPELALFSETPMQFYDAILKFAKIHLSKNGSILFELNEFNAKETKDLALFHKFSNIEIIKDIQGKDRILLVNQYI